MNHSVVCVVCVCVCVSVCVCVCMCVCMCVYEFACVLLLSNPALLKIRLALGVPAFRTRTAIAAGQRPQGLHPSRNTTGEPSFAA